MEVITENPIIYINSLDSEDADTFLYLDGKSTYSELRAFQEWANSMYNAKLKPDGTWGTNTAKAWAKYQKEYETEMSGGSSSSKISQSVSDMMKNRGIVPPSITNPTPAQIQEAKKKGLNWDSVNKVFKKAEELGIVDSILSKLGITPRTTTPPVGVDAPLDPMGSPSSESGMSTTTKVLIGVGALAVVGLIIYSSSNKTPKGK
jgi:hypothetical protein